MLNAPKTLPQIRVYSISDDNTLQENCYDSDRGWYTGALNHSKIAVDPSSKIAASFLAVDGLKIRIYVQKIDNTIQEYGWDGKTTTNLTLIVG